MSGIRKIALPLVPLLLAVAMLAPTSLALSVGASSAYAQTPQEHQYGDPADGSSIDEDTIKSIKMAFDRTLPLFAEGLKYLGDYLSDPVASYADLEDLAEHYRFWGNSLETAGKILGLATKFLSPVADFVINVADGYNPHAAGTKAGLTTTFGLGGAALCAPSIVGTIPCGIVGAGFGFIAGSAFDLFYPIYENPAQRHPDAPPPHSIESPALGPGEESLTGSEKSASPQKGEAEEEEDRLPGEPLGGGEQ